MSLNIKDEQTDTLVRQLAERTGESITVATRVAVEERLARLAAQPRHTSRDELLDIVRRGRARRTHDDSRTDDEILGYGADGLPT